MQPSPTHRASFSIGNEAAARRVVDVLTEVFFEGDAAVAAFEQPDGQWDVTLHFAEAPDQELLRELVATSAGNEIAATLAFDTIEAKDWVKASLEDLVPVPAGRFVVHGSHDRDRVAPNKLKIEIEAALAFGTGHHGTTRGCLLLLDHVLKHTRPKRVLDLGTGTGVLGIAAAKALHRPVLASDIDTSALEDAQNPPFEVRRHDLTVDPPPAAEFDLVHARLVLEHLTDPSMALVALVTALRPGGWLALLTSEERYPEPLRTRLRELWMRYSRRPMNPAGLFSGSSTSMRCFCTRCSLSTTSS